MGRERQNIRVAARLTGLKIDIKSEMQARESGDLLEYEEDYYEDEDTDESADDQELNSEQTQEGEPEIAAAEADDELPAEEE